MPSSQAVAVLPQPVAPAFDTPGADASAACGLVVAGKKAKEAQRAADALVSVATTASRMASDLRASLQAARTPPFVLRWQPGRGGVPSGYAVALPASLAAQTASKAARSKGSKGRTSGASTRGEWGFLNDSHMSIEDKLFLFMKTVQKKNDAELDKKMKEYKEKYVDDKGGGDGGGGLFGSLGDALGGIFGGGLLKKAFEQLGGLVLSAGATALGMPQLAPVLASVGKDIGRAVGSAVGSSLGVSSGSSRSSGSSEKKEEGTPDEKFAMLEIQRLVEKQNQMFNCISNVLKNLHETAMNAIGNIR